jgi:hypothetical protein
MLNCPNPSVNNYPGKTYKTAWAMLDKIKKEIFTAEELTVFKDASKSIGKDPIVTVVETSKKVSSPFNYSQWLTDA